MTSPPREENRSLGGPEANVGSSTLESPQINRPPVKLALLTCQVRPNPEERRCFDLVTRE